MSFDKDSILAQLTAAYTGPGSTDEGTFAGDVLRACADMMAQFYSMEIDGLERRAFVSTASGEWLTKVCADRGVDRREGESDEDLRSRTLLKLSSLPASGNADHYAVWCSEIPEILRVRVLPLSRGAGTLDIVAVDQEGHCPSDEILAAAQAAIDAQRPVGADAQMVGANEILLEITASVAVMDGAILADIQNSFQSSLSTFCRETALRTSVISYAKVLQLLLNTPGVADVSGFRINGGEGSLQLSDVSVAVAGSVTLSEVSA